MKQTPRTKSIKKISHILNKYNFTSKELVPCALDTFSEMADALASEIIAYNTTPLSAEQRTHKLEIVIDNIDKLHEEPTLNSTTKKISVIFMLLRKMVQEDMMDETLKAFFQHQINRILKEELPKLLAPRQKRPSSINKLYSYIRELSGSKDKNCPGRTALEKQTDKGAVKQIINNIFQPYCCYLLKILQNHQWYKAVLRRSEVKEGLQWTTMNSAKTLGQIIYQLHRFGRYFINDLMGILLYMTLLASKDMALYYDVLMGQAEREAVHWEQLIEIEDRRVREGAGSEGRQIYKMNEFKQIKGLIDQLMGLRQKIHYIFGHKGLKNYRYLFSKPNTYNLREETTSSSFEIILQYNRKSSRWHSQSQSLSKLNKTSKSYRFLQESQQIFSQKMLPQEQKDENLDINQEDLEYKLTNNVSSKHRMNNWLNKVEKNKLARIPPAIHDKDDHISTNSNE